jgi:hypothetical protein
MKPYLRIFLSVMFITTLAVLPAWADTPANSAPAPDSAPVATQNTIAQLPGKKEPTYYNYAHDEAEYSVMLPEAPTVQTIWSETPDTKLFLTTPPTDGASIGELATFKRVDIDTEETFDVKIIFLKARKNFLEGLTKDKIKDMLTKQYKDSPLSNAKFTISSGTSALKWASFSGFALDTYHHPAFYAIHYLTGQQSILVIQVSYSIENKLFQDYYDHLVNSITYVAP